MREAPAARGLRRFVASESGASALEYAILVGVVSAAFVATVTTFSDEIGVAVSQIGSNLVSTASGIGF